MQPIQEIHVLQVRPTRVTVLVLLAYLGTVMEAYVLVLPAVPVYIHVHQATTTVMAMQPMVVNVPRLPTAVVALATISDIILVQLVTHKAAHHAMLGRAQYKAAAPQTTAHRGLVLHVHPAQRTAMQIQRTTANAPRHPTAVAQEYTIITGFTIAQYVMDQAVELATI